MSEKTLVLDRTGREWPVGHWAIKYWYEFVHLVVAAEDSRWGLDGAFMRRDLGERIVGVKEYEEQLLSWAKANEKACGLYYEPPIPVNTVDALDALCEHFIEPLARVAEWQDRLRDGIAGIKAVDEPPLPNTWIPASDYCPNILIRRVAEIVRRLPGADKPDDPGRVTDVDAAKAYLERVRQWCRRGNDSGSDGISDAKWRLLRLYSDGASDEMLERAADVLERQLPWTRKLSNWTKQCQFQSVGPRRKSRTRSAVQQRRSRHRRGGRRIALAKRKKALRNE